MRARGADVAQVDGFLRVQVAAVLDGVHEQLAESGGDLFALVGLQIAGQFAHKLSETIGGGNPAADLQRNPIRLVRKDLDVVVAHRSRTTRCEAWLRSAVARKRLADVGGGLAPQRSQNVLRRILDGHHDHRDAGMTRRAVGREARDRPCPASGCPRATGRRSWLRAAWSQSASSPFEALSASQPVPASMAWTSS